MPAIGDLVLTPSEPGLKRLAVGQGTEYVGTRRLVEADR
jgi:hypothetical protein